jgi:hypothetical protein
MKKKLYLYALTAVLAMTTTQTMAAELWDTQLRAVTEGQPAGALPPPGVYGSLSNYFMSYKQYDNKANTTGVAVDALIEAPGMLWSTGLKVLGADYAVAIAQPFDYSNLKIAGNAAIADNGHWGSYNTLIAPALLSWSLPNDLHVKTGLTVSVDDASSSPADPPANHGLGSGNSYWALQPELGLSWLYDGWNLSFDAHYDYNFKDSKTDYRSGNDITVDYTIAKTIEKWTFGVGFYQHNQLNKDRGAGAVAAGCNVQGGCMNENYGGGPLVGYHFSEFDVLAVYNHNFYTRNVVAGDLLNIVFSKAF